MHPNRTILSKSWSRSASRLTAVDFVCEWMGQTKGSYATYEAAEAAGMAIKNDYPMLEVGVYDSVESVHKIIEHT